MERYKAVIKALAGFSSLCLGNVLSLYKDEFHDSEIELPEFSSLCLGNVLSLENMDDDELMSLVGVFVPMFRECSFTSLHSQRSSGNFQDHVFVPMFRECSFTIKAMNKVANVTGFSSLCLGNVLSLRGNVLMIVFISTTSFRPYV